MNIKCAAAALGTAFIIASAPSFASAETVQVSPIRIDRVEIEQSYEVYNQFEPGLVSVTFTNTNAAVATDIGQALGQVRGGAVGVEADDLVFKRGGTHGIIFCGK